MVEEFVWVTVQTWQRLLGIEIVIGLLRGVVQGRIGISVGAAEGGVGVIRQAVDATVEYIIVRLIF